MLIGSLCTGYSGLEMAAQNIFGGELAWVADNAVPARKLLEYRYPDVPNLGDLTVADWSNVEPVQILTAGFPCQPISIAGRKLGQNDERWIWPELAGAIRVLRPEYVLLENVENLIRLGLGDVLGDLATLGYDARWTCVRASEAGAPHRRERWFCAAHPKVAGLEGGLGEELQVTGPVGGGSGSSPDSDGEGLEGTSRKELPELQSGTGNGTTDWERFTTRIRLWERVLGRPAPLPRVTGRKTKERLNPVFTEWMMGLPEGWVTGVPGLSYREQLHLLGNGVVPQQAEHAYRSLI